MIFTTEIYLCPHMNNKKKVVYCSSSTVRGPRKFVKAQKCSTFDWQTLPALSEQLLEICENGFSLGLLLYIHGLDWLALGEGGTRCPASYPDNN